MQMLTLEARAEKVGLKESGLGNIRNTRAWDEFSKATNAYSPFKQAQCRE